MTDSPPNPTDDFDLLYVVGKSGWSDLHVVTSKNVFAIQITDIVSNPIFELIGFCKALLLGQQSCTVRLYDEPGAIVIAASVIQSQRHIVHVEFWSCSGWEQEPSDGTLLLEFDIKILQFTGLFYRQFEKVQWLYEDKKYRKDRGNFPHQEFEELQELCRGRDAKHG